MQSEQVHCVGNCWTVIPNFLNGTTALDYLSSNLCTYVFDSHEETYLRLLQKSVEEGNVVVKITGRLYKALRYSRFEVGGRREVVNLLVYKSGAEDPSFILKFVFTDNPPNRYGGTTGRIVNISGNATCESCSKDFVQDLFGRCGSELDPLYFRCGRCRRLQLFVLLRKKLGRDLAKMIVVVAKNQESV